MKKRGRKTNQSIEAARGIRGDTRHSAVWPWPLSREQNWCIFYFSLNCTECDMWTRTARENVSPLNLTWMRTHNIIKHFYVLSQHFTGCSNSHCSFLGLYWDFNYYLARILHHPQEKEKKKTWARLIISVAFDNRSVIKLVHCLWHTALYDELLSHFLPFIT